VDADNPGVEIIHRGKYKSLTSQQRRWLKRCQAVEPAIGHANSDSRMDRGWLQGALGDALHALSCAAGYNIRWLMRAIVRLAAKRSFCALSELTVYARLSAICSPGGLLRALRSMLVGFADLVSLPTPPTRPALHAG